MEITYTTIIRNSRRCT